MYSLKGCERKELLGYGVGAGDFVKLKATKNAAIIVTLFLDRK